MTLRCSLKIFIILLFTLCLSLTAISITTDTCSKANYPYSRGTQSETPLEFSEGSPGLSLSVRTDKEMYNPGENVTILGYVYDSYSVPIEGAAVSLEAKDPFNNTIFLDIIYTTANGSYIDRFRLHKDSLLGLYYVYATASASGYTPASNMCTFSVGGGFHDISIINLEYSPKQPVVNQTLTITVVVANLGNYTETFELSVNYTILHDPIIGTKTITLAPKETITINFTWRPNTAERYQIIAYVSSMPEDSNLSNNRKEIIIYVTLQTISGGSNAGIRMYLLK